jgi:putative glutathione S-transferase
MSSADARGFADPADYDRHGHYLRKSAAGSADLALYQFRFRDRISRDGSTPYRAEAGRYHLYLALSCPWAQRAAIVVNLLGLGDVISHSLVDDVRDGRGWAFRERRGCDPINNFSFLKQAYLVTDPAFVGHVNVPTLWDRKTGRVVNNADDDIFWDVMTHFGEWAENPIDLYPQAYRVEIDCLDATIHENVNFGVYRAAVSSDQHDHHIAMTRVFDTLDWLEERLETTRYLFGDTITETDIRLWVTLARFDVVYNPLFKVNLRRLVDYPNLWAYARDLYSLPAFAQLTDFGAFKFSYDHAFPLLSRADGIPAGPIVDWSEPQQRARIGRKANGDRPC